MGRSLAVAVLALAVVTAAAGTGGAATTAAKLRLDGVRFRPEAALTPTQRAVGLMDRPEAPADGMLFVFPRDTRGGFWMKNVVVPLRIVFFDARGRRVAAFSMTPCREDPCPVYTPRRRYRFALELAASDPRPARTLAPPVSLRRLSRAAR